MRIIPIQPVKMTKTVAATVCGGLSQTTKMPCKSSSLPTEACITGFEMAKIKSSICSLCYADRGNYLMYANNIKPAQFARLDALWRAMEDREEAQLWLSAMVALIGSDEYFRHHDSGDLQGLAHLELIAELALLTPNTKHWLPTREYGIVKEYLDKHGALPDNLIVRLSAMYFDKPVKVPLSLQDIRNVTVSNAHKDGAPMGYACNAPKQGGKCLDCRACWTDITVSYQAH